MKHNPIRQGLVNKLKKLMHFATIKV